METPPPHILVVDDEFIIAQDYALTLKNFGYLVDMATNREKAFGFLQKKFEEAGGCYDMVISDGRLVSNDDNYTGLDVLCKAAKIAGEARKHCFLVLMSGIEVDEERVEELKQKLGIDDFFFLPKLSNGADELVRFVQEKFQKALQESPYKKEQFEKMMVELKKFSHGNPIIRKYLKASQN
jgi:response regulator RpfG family c-di-GMP phosphodiesterase